LVNQVVKTRTIAGVYTFPAREWIFSNHAFPIFELSGNPKIIFDPSFVQLFKNPPLPSGFDYHQYEDDLFAEFGNYENLVWVGKPNPLGWNSFELVP